ncbi:hypothetical protein Tco_0569620 [Tanacetum coccineum]
MVPTRETLVKHIIEGLPRSIEGNVTASKPQTLEEAINISQRIEDKKPSKFILPPMGILETIPCAKDVDYITQDLAVSSVRVLLIRRTRLTPTSLEMRMCLKDYMDAVDQVQHTSNLENSLDFEAKILEEEVQEHEAMALSDEEVALDEAASEARSNGGEEIYAMTLSESD